MRVLLFYPPITVQGNDPTTPGIAPPLGLANIAAYIEREGYDVAICDALAEGFKTVKKAKNYLRVGLSKKSIIEKINYYRPDIVGISVMFTAFAPDAHDLAKIVKRVSPQTLVIFGGAHSSVMPNSVLADKNIDLVVIGEGEETFLEILKRTKAKRSLKNILGTAVRQENDQIKINKPRPFIKNLDSLPFPARHLLPMDLYLKDSQDDENSYLMRYPSSTVVSSRGCPNNCIYCAVPRIWGRRWRPFSAQRVLDEIEFLVKRYGVREVHFLDDNFSVNRERLEMICEGIIKRGLDIKWTCPNGIAIWTLDRPIIKKMKKSGCYRLTFGIESGCPETQKFIRKNLNLKKAKKIMKIASDLGLWTFSTYIIGFPYETAKAMERTFNYALSSYSDFVGFILLMPFPGTDVTEIMIKEGLIKENDLDKKKIAAWFSGYQGVGNKYLTSAELNNLQSKAHKRLMISRLLWPLTHFLTLLHKIHSFEDATYLFKILKNYLFMFVSTLRFKEFKTHRIRQALNLHLKAVDKSSEKENS